MDGLRAIAVAGVVGFHAAPAWLPGGWAGVDLFFVLSGFLITGIVVREIDATGRLDLGRFYRRRAQRILPAFAAMLAGVGLLALMLGTAAVATGTAALYAASFTINWCRAFGWAADGALGHSWSLAIEQQFYLCWPLLMLATGRRRRVPVTAALAVAILGWRCLLVAHGASMDRTYNGFDTHADALLIGGLLAMLDTGPAARPMRLASVLALAAAALFALTVDPRLPATQSIGLSVAALGSAALIACARRPGWLAEALGRRPLTAIGRRSYGIYLWHYPLLHVGRPRLPLALGGVVPVLLALVLAALSWRYVERPILALGADRRRKQAGGRGLAAGPA